MRGTRVHNRRGPNLGARRRRQRGGVQRDQCAASRARGVRSGWVFRCQRRIAQNGGNFSSAGRDLAERRDLFQLLCGFGSDRVGVGPANSLEPTLVAWVSGHYYDTLGLTPQAGRLLTPADDEPGAAPAAVISDAYWMRRFGRTGQAIGQSILIEGVSVPIVGVHPRGFVGASGRSADLTLASSRGHCFDPINRFRSGLRTLAGGSRGRSPASSRTLRQGPASYGLGSSLALGDCSGRTHNACRKRSSVSLRTGQPRALAFACLCNCDGVVILGC